MAELEIHHEGHESDPFAQRIGVVAAFIGIVLAVVTIQSHRSHTEAVILKSDENDKWAYYQSKSVKRNEYAIAAELARLNSSGGSVEQAVAKFEKEKDRYDKETEEIQAEARKVEAEVRVEEANALRYDVGEGLLELGLVLCSLFFISKRKIFPFVGITAASIGLLIAVTALWSH
jgi:hypothetical protein